MTCSLLVAKSGRRLGGSAGPRPAWGATKAGRGGAAGAWMRTRPTAPVAASTYQGPESATMTPERGGSEDPRLAFDESPPAGMPARLAAFDQCIQNVGHQPDRHTSACLGPFAQ